VSIFQVGHLERLPLGTTYPAIVQHVGRLLARLPEGTELCIDYTGVGRPVFDLFRYSCTSPIGVLITSGVSEAIVDGIAHVPKLVLISRLQVLLHEGRLKIQRDLPEAKNLVSELMDFRVQYTAAGHLTFNAREGRHDDLVLALAIACYRAAGGGLRYEGLLYYLATLASHGACERRYFVGVDLGQSRDPTAVAVVRRVEDPGAAVGDLGLAPDAAGEAALQAEIPALGAQGAGILYAAPYASFQAASGKQYWANEVGEITCGDREDARDLIKAGCRERR